MQLKSRQIILYLFACFILLLSGLAGGSLLAIGLLLQILILLKGLPFTARTQWGLFRLLLISLPLLLFWGGAHSFMMIYMQEGSWAMALLAIGLSMALSLILGFQLIHSISYIEETGFQVLPGLQAAFNDIRTHHRTITKNSLALFVLSFVPWLPVEWKLVFALTVMYFYLNFQALKKAFSAQ